MISDYRKLEGWQKSILLVQEIYSTTKDFPNDEKFGLVAQMRRAAVSIPSNIAEGKMRGTDPEFKRFLFIALGSGAELETQLEIAKNNKFLSEDIYAANIKSLSVVMKMLNAFIKKVGK